MKLTEVHCKRETNFILTIYLRAFLQLQKIERKLNKTADEHLIEKYASIFDELKRLDLILPKVRADFSTITLTLILQLAFHLCSRAWTMCSAPDSQRKWLRLKATKRLTIDIYLVALLLTKRIRVKYHEALAVLHEVSMVFENVRISNCNE